MFPGIALWEQLWQAASGTARQVMKIKGLQAEKKEGTERQLATYGEHLGLLPKGIFIWEHLGPAP